MRATFILVATLTLPVFAAGQSSSPAAADQRPRFDAASIKPNLSKDEGMMHRPSPGRLVYGNVPISNVVEQAYGMRPDRIVNYPPWAETERFDVTATYNPEQQKQVRPMLQTLLEERFSLRVHRETRDMPVYELVKARADGQLGPRIRPSTADCISKAGERSLCTLLIQEGRFRGIGTGWGNGEVLSLNIGVWDRPIIDKTGLTGAFDIDLEWTPDPAQARDDAGARRAAAVAATPGERTSIFTALQEQLGLRLQPARAPLEVLVVDRLERPTAD
jgi:bla regulator protein BlaR1